MAGELDGAGDNPGITMGSPSIAQEAGARRSTVQGTSQGASQAVRREFGKRGVHIPADDGNTRAAEIHCSQRLFATNGGDLEQRAAASYHEHVIVERNEPGT